MLYKKLLKEGRYDSLVRRISNDIFSFIKKENEDEVAQLELPYDVDGEEFYFHESGLEIVLEVFIKKTTDIIIINNKPVPYNVNTYISTDDYIIVEIILNEDYGTDFYEEIYYKINEDIRHEIEHFLQDIFSDRLKSHIRDTSKYKTTFKHHMDPSEIEALVHGFYRRAKLEKKYLDHIMIDDINKEISLGKLTKKEGEILLKTWLNYADKKLPKAKISKKY